MSQYLLTDLLRKLGRRLLIGSILTDLLRKLGRRLLIDSILTDLLRKLGRRLLIGSILTDLLRKFGRRLLIGWRTICTGTEFVSRLYHFSSRARPSRKFRLPEKNKYVL